jgi:hypothetical protein
MSDLSQLALLAAGIYAGVLVFRGLVRLVLMALYRLFP